MRASPANPPPVSHKNSRRVRPQGGLLRVNRFVFIVVLPVLAAPPQLG